MPTDASLYSRLAASMTGAGAKIAFAVPGKSAVTYSDLLDRIGRVANALRSVGVEPGDRVTAQVEKSIENVTLYLATLKIGAIFNPLNTAYTPVELEYFIADAEPALLVVSVATQSALAATAAAKIPRKTLTMEADGSGSLTALAGTMKADCATAPRAAADIAALLYTSGTTGRSKGAMITHDNLVSNAQTLSTYWGFKPDDVLLHALADLPCPWPFRRAAYRTPQRRKPCSGSTSFDLDAVLEASAPRDGHDGRSDILHAAAGQRASSGTLPASAPGYFRFGTAAGRNPRRLRAAHRPQDSRALRHDRSWHDHIQSLPGRRAPCRHRRLCVARHRCPRRDPRRQTVRRRCRRARSQGAEYFQAIGAIRKRPSEEFRADGFFISGDLATIATDGRITIVGRAKDLIISGGFNVYPKEIETEINELPGVGESAVIGCRTQILAKALSRS